MSKSGASPSHVEVVATVADGHLSKLDDVANALRSAGLAVSHTLAGSGIITGTAPRGALAALRKVKGVAAIEQAGGVQIAPPDADIQ